MNAHRGEVFGAIYTVVEQDRLDLRVEPAVGTAERLLTDWRTTLQREPSLVIGDAVSPARAVIERRLGPTARLMAEMPVLAPVVARRAATSTDRERTGPHAIRPVYVRRPDAELARERRAAATENPRAD